MKNDIVLDLLRRVYYIPVLCILYIKRVCVIMRVLFILNRYHRSNVVYNSFIFHECFVHCIPIDEMRDIIWLSNYNFLLRYTMLIKCEIALTVFHVISSIDISKYRKYNIYLRRMIIIVIELGKLSFHHKATDTKAFIKHLLK